MSAKAEMPKYSTLCYRWTRTNQADGRRPSLGSSSVVEMALRHFFNPGCDAEIERKKDWGRWQPSTTKVARQWWIRPLGSIYTAIADLRRRLPHAHQLKRARTDPLKQQYSSLDSSIDPHDRRMRSWRMVAVCIQLSSANISKYSMSMYTGFNAQH